MIGYYQSLVALLVLHLSNAEINLLVEVLDQMLEDADQTPNPIAPALAQSYLWLRLDLAQTPLKQEADLLAKHLLVVDSRMEAVPNAVCIGAASSF